MNRRAILKAMLLLRVTSAENDMLELVNQLAVWLEGEQCQE